ncbi:hypothetical protein SAMN05444161_7065 [Rhizobiales bacterium GAS191]|nr:hypothetical protein SAMN05444161_7065 [Rhizobiales bacterium GAS191]
MNRLYIDPGVWATFIHERAALLDKLVDGTITSEQVDRLNSLQETLSKFKLSVVHARASDESNVVPFRQR